MTMIITPLVSVNDIVVASKLTSTSQLIAETSSILMQVDWILRSYVGNRYNLDQFTEDNLVWSKAIELLKSITLQASLGKLLMSAYWVQMLNDWLNANYLYETQVTMLENIWKWVIRLLDKNNKEFSLVPLPNRNATKSVSTFWNRWKQFFSTNDKR